MSRAASIRNTAGRHPARGRPTARQSALLAEHIVNAAWQVVLDVGPEHFSLDRVALAARVSKQTIYVRFSGKAELLQAIADSKVDLVLTAMNERPAEGDIHSVFTDLVRRMLLSLTDPEARMLDRLVDWIDANSSGAETFRMRTEIYARMSELLEEHLREATRRWAVVVDNIPAAAAFWLDCLVGHLRGLPDEGARRGEAWSAQFSEYFLRAVCRACEQCD